MKTRLLMAFLCLYGSFCLAQHPAAIQLPLAKFSTGNDPAWKNPKFDDSQWKELKTDLVWQAQGYPDYHGNAWYRIHVVIPSSLRSGGHWKDSLRIFLAHVNDVDETFLNGIKIGQIGSFPEDPGGYVSKWPAIREYHLPIGSTAIKWDQDNVIAIRDYDGGGTGGMFMGEPYLDMLEKTDGLSLGCPAEKIQYSAASKTQLPLELRNHFNTAVKGRLTYSIYDAMLKKEITKTSIPVGIQPFGQKEYTIDAPGGPGITCHYSFTEEATALVISGKIDLPYILTPAPPATPRINSPAIFGASPGAPFLFRIAATGQRPMRYTATGLPSGLQIDPATGIITGTPMAAGIYEVAVKADNTAGHTLQKLTIKIGDQLALTPTMGWNSWNCWGTSVSDEKVRSSAKALIDKGLVDHGWSYINIDDGWQATHRSPDSTILPNEKFGNMRALGDWLHGQGLKFGIYSSPGPKTCGGFLGSWRNEAKDAGTYASWGIDYLKYDWCSYDGIAGSDTALATYTKPYELMRTALQKQKRDIVYNLCQYGMKDVWKWGPMVGAQSWRTTEDIEDTWESMKNIGFRQDSLYPYAQPGHWNDPDMMIVGQVGWGENLHPSRLTPDEQYTHVSLWCLLAAPLLIGCDISKLDPFTLNLLTNDEVLAIDQDPLGRQAKRLVESPQCQVWTKELADGSTAVGIFNMDTVSNQVAVDLPALLEWTTPATVRVRDAWRQKDLGLPNGKFDDLILPHGVRLLIVKK